MKYLICLSLALLVSFGVLNDALAQVDCGVIESSTVPVLMTRNVRCSGDLSSSAITLEGPLTLQMQGHTLICTSLNNDGRTGDGFRLTGHRVRLIGPGRIIGCQDGVVLSGSGAHVVRKVTIARSAPSVITSGVRSFSSSNTIKSTVIKNIRGLGISISGNSDGNRILGNRISKTGFEGIDMSEPSAENTGRNTLIRNNRLSATGGGNLLSAIQLAGNARALKNRIVRSSGNGIQVRRGASNVRIANNVIIQAGQHGIEITATSSINTVLRNKVRDSKQNGIFIQEQASGNRIGGNKVSGSMATDLVDDNRNCDNNNWFANVFGTSNRGCIR